MTLTTINLMRKLIKVPFSSMPKEFFCAIHSNNQHEKVFFGNETVTSEKKTKKVHEVFQNVATRYDLMNDLMSGGIHRLWKDYFILKLGAKPGLKLLDVAGGTGDITFRVMHSIREQMKRQQYSKPYKEVDVQLNTDPQITVCDLSENMLNVGKERAKKLGFHDINWVCGDAQDLPFPDNEFDAYTISYGIRNVPNIDKALREAHRVLKVGGRFLCLEFSQVSNSFIKRMYDAYSFQMIPVMGQIVAADWDSYQYLVQSIRKFPDQIAFSKMIENAGFQCVKYENLTFGITAIHTGFKI